MKTVRVHMFVSACNYQRADEEVVVDQGGTSSVMNIHYEKEELEGELTCALEQISSSSSNVEKWKVSDVRGVQKENI